MLDDDEHTVIRDHLDIYQTIMENCKRYGAMSISEDYLSWKEAKFHQTRAKLLMIDESDYST